MQRTLSTLVLLMTFSPLLYMAFPVISLVDEVFLGGIILTCIPLLAVKILRAKISGFWVLLMCYFCCSLLIYDNVTLTVIGLFYLFKLPILVVLFLALVPYGNHKRELSFFFSTLIFCILTANLMFFVLHNYVVGLGYDQQYGEIFRNMGFFPTLKETLT